MTEVVEKKVDVNNPTIQPQWLETVLIKILDRTESTYYEMVLI